MCDKDCCLLKIRFDNDLHRPYHKISRFVRPFILNRMPALFKCILEISPSPFWLCSISFFYDKLSYFRCVKSRRRQTCRVTRRRMLMMLMSIRNRHHRHMRTHHHSTLTLLPDHLGIVITCSLRSWFTVLLDFLQLSCSWFCSQWIIFKSSSALNDDDSNTKWMKYFRIKCK